MRNFSTICKRNLKQILLPLGYRNRKSAFFKLEDDIFIIVCIKGEFSEKNSMISAYIEPFPYCCGGVSYEDIDFSGLVCDTLSLVLQRILPEKFAVEDYYRLIGATSEEGTLKNLDFVIKALEDYALPYIHKFTDLEFYYKEYPILIPSPTGNPFAVSQELFGLSIKLRKYENAAFYVDRWISIFDSELELAETELKKLRNGELDETLLLYQKYHPKKFPKTLELHISAAEMAIPKYRKDKAEWQTIKDALLENDHGFLGNYIKQIEDRNRKLLHEMLADK